MLCDSLDIVDHYKNLAQVFGVADDLYEFASFDTNEAAAEAAAAAKAKRLAEIKQKKDLRRESIDRTMLTIIEFMAEILEISTEELIESIVENDIKTDCLHRFFSQNGSESLVLSFSPKLDAEHRVDILHEKEYIQTDQCVIAYRTDHTTDITLKNMPNVNYKHRRSIHAIDA